MLPLLLVLLPYDTWFSGLVLLLISSILLKITHMTVADRVNLRVKSGKMGSGKVGSGKMGGNRRRYGDLSTVYGTCILRNYRGKEVCRY